jgi:phospholipase C
MKIATKILVPLLALGTATAAAASSNIPQVQHVIIVIQENRTPDNLFNEDSTLINNGGDVQPPNNQGYCGATPITLTSTPLYTCWDPDHSHGATKHSYGAWESAWDSGKMDGACGETIFCPDGVCTTNDRCSNSVCNSNWQNCPYTYVDNTIWNPHVPNDKILDPYFQLSQQYGFANLMFQTNQGPSFPAHQFLFSGTSAPTAPTDLTDKCDGSQDWYCYQWFAAENIGISGQNDYGCIGTSGSLIYLVDPDTDESYSYQPPLSEFPNGQPPPGFPCYEHPTLSDLLGSANPQITWRYYARTATDLWTAPDAIDHICLPTGVGGSCAGLAFTGESPAPPNVLLPSYNKATQTGDAAPVLTDIESCTLQQVSWVIPDGNWSDHSNYSNIQQGSGGDGGPSWVAAIVNAVGNATSCDSGTGYWNDTVILVTWDDWGGYYDHVPPLACGPGQKCGYPNGTGTQYVYGFRVPLLAISAYAVQTAQPPAQYTGYVSTTPHDFGSILNFVEYALAPQGQRLGGQYGVSGDQLFPYADYFAPDTLTGGGPYNYGLYDFFTYSKPNSTPIPFRTVLGAKYPETCFHNPLQSGCFSTYPLDPDNDANE